MTLRSIHIGILGLLLGSVSAAYAQVAKVEVTPSPAILGQPATVTVTGGSAPCGAVEINYGDGMAITYPTTILPYVQSHTWNTVGNKTVVATGHGNCTGQATVTVGVVKAKVGAGVGVNKGTQMYAMRIKSYFGLSQPGGVAAIAGENFGAEPGRVVAKLMEWTGTIADVPLTIIGWSPTLIEVEWPAGIVGVRDQMNAVVEATNAINTHKASWKVFFRAETDYKLLPMSEVRLVTCGNGGNYDSCNGSEYVGSCGYISTEFRPPVPKCAGSFRGFHANCWGTVGNDSGTDEFAVRLRQDWVISGVDFKKNTPGNGLFKSSEGAVGNPSPPAQTGSAAWNARVKWEVTPDDFVSYCAFVHISGPKGVPFK